MRVGSRQRTVISKMVAASAGVLVLTGCATFGGNVRGSFSCAAPDGTCAPSAMIDDRALEMVSAEVGGDLAATQAPTRLRPFLSAAAGSKGPPRSPEKILKIVFLPFVDDRGRLHDSSIVHAVVATGDWISASTGFATAPVDQKQLALGSAEPLADIVDRADPPGAVHAAHDPNAPDPVAVADARARRADPVGAIKADVAARLAPASDSNKVRMAAEELVLPPPTGTPPALGAPLLAPAAADIKLSDRAVNDNDTGDRSAAEAVSEGARGANARASARPSAATPVVRAPGFPATSPEDN